jgi:hypothetical protein
MGYELWGCSADASECGVYGCDCEEGPCAMGVQCECQ